MPKKLSHVSVVWRRQTQYFVDHKGLVHVCGGSFGANSLMVCEADDVGGLDVNMRGMTEVYDRPVTCLQCLAATS